MTLWKGRGREVKLNLKRFCNRAKQPNLYTAQIYLLTKPLTFLGTPVYSRADCALFVVIDCGSQHQSLKLSESESLSVGNITTV